MPFVVIYDSIQSGRNQWCGAKQILVTVLALVSVFYYFGFGFQRFQYWFSGFDFYLFWFQFLIWFWFMTFLAVFNHFGFCFAPQHDKTSISINQKGFIIGIHLSAREKWVIAREKESVWTAFKNDKREKKYFTRNNNNDWEINKNERNIISKNEISIIKLNKNTYSHRLKTFTRHYFAREIKYFELEKRKLYW